MTRLLASIAFITALAAGAPAGATVEGYILYNVPFQSVQTDDVCFMRLPLLTSFGIPAAQMAQASLTATAVDRGDDATRRAARYWVEVHKKWAISVACLVFAVVGIPMALRFPRGGMGLVIGGGLFVFSIYYVGLIAGEGLGNKDIVSPATAMWAPNVIFAIGGLFGLYRVGRESGSTRGGDLADLWDTLTGRFRRRRAA